MDRRYEQARFYNGMRARAGTDPDAIVRRYLGEARRRNHAAQSYGGSAQMGARSATPQAGLAVLAERAATSREQRKIYQEQGSGVFGGRAELKRARRLEEAGDAAG